MEQNGNYETLMTEMSEIQSKLETFGKEYLKLGSELAHLTYTLSTNPTESSQKAKENLVYGLWVATCAVKSLSQLTETVQQSVVSPPSTSKSTTSGKGQEWLETWYDSWTTSLNSLSKTHQENFQKLFTPPSGKDQSA